MVTKNQSKSGDKSTKKTEKKVTNQAATLAAKEKAVKKKRVVNKKAIRKKPDLKIISTEERYHLTQERAYFIAEQRNFQNSSELDDWLMAEKEIGENFSCVS